jgi:tetratricopeptide (TPR) repeat protein
VNPERSEAAATLFEEALSVVRERRSAFLDETCGSDAALREEVASLLQAYEQAPGYFDALQSQIIGPAIADIASRAESPVTVGDTVAGYRIEALLGSGGMGVVYKARDLALDRVVALKFLAPAIARIEKARSQFVIEARTASALDHPNICTIHRVAETDAGEPFIAMALYDGETLRDRLARGPLPVAEAVQIGTQLARGLAAAHERRILHRDLKPANVAITSGGLVKILDFGLAGVVDTRTAPSDATPKGTVAYMAPEQFRGGRGDERTDLWALGVVLYEMLAGQRPFEGETAAALLYQVLEHAPEAIEDRCPDLPRDLQQVVETLLQKDPAARFARATDVLAALEQVGSSTPDSQLDGAVYRRRGAVGIPRSRSTVLLSTAGLLAMAGLAFFWAFDRTPLPDAGALPIGTARSIAVLPFNVRGDSDVAYLREGMVDLLSTKMDGLGELRSVDSHHLLGYMARNAPDRADPQTGRQVAEFFRANYFILGSVVEVDRRLQVSASLYDASGRSELARARVDGVSEAELLPRLDELAQQLVAGQLDNPDRRLANLAALTTNAFPALRSYLEGERELREGRFTEARTSFEAAVSRDSSFGLAWYRLARVTGWIGPSALNEHAANQAVAHSGNMPDRARRLVLAYNVFRRGHPAEAERLYRSLLASYPDDREVSLVLGEALFHNNPSYGRSTAEARAPLEQALMYDPARREVMVHLMDLAARRQEPDVLMDLGDRFLRTPGEAGDLDLWHAYRGLRTLGVEGPGATAAVVKNLTTAGPGALTTALNRIAPQIEDLSFAESLANALAAPGHAPAHRAFAYLTLANLETARGRWRSAESALQTAQALAPGWALIQRALTASLPFSPENSSELRALRMALTQWKAESLYDSQHEGDLAAVRQLLIGLVSVRLDDPDGARAAMQQLQGAAGPGGEGDSIDDRHAATIEAYLAWRQGRLDDALTALDRAQLHLPFHARERSPIYAQALNRFLRAEIMYAQGRDEEALAWLESLHDGYYHWGSPFLGPSLERQALIHQRLGRRGRAVQLLQHCLDLWKQSDPDGGELLTRVRQHLAGA